MRRDRATLIPIIERECKVGSVIHSDEWPAYLILNDIGYHHKTVNHQKNYVNPISGAHTQGIERSWLDARIYILKKKKRSANSLIPIPFRLLLLESSAKR